MFCDFNVAYSYNREDPDVKFVTAERRAGIAMVHIANIPLNIVAAVIEVAKLIFFSVLAALCFGQSITLNSQVEVSARKLAYNMAKVGISVVGFFAPMNAGKWELELIEKLMVPYIGNPNPDYDKNERLALGLLNIN